MDSENVNIIIMFEGTNNKGGEKSISKIVITLKMGGGGGIFFLLQQGPKSADVMSLTRTFWRQMQSQRLSAAAESLRQLSKQQRFKQKVMKHYHFHCSPWRAREEEEEEVEEEEEEEEGGRIHTSDRGSVSSGKV